MNVLEARARAQHLAFGPMVFQAVRVLWRSGLLAEIEAAGERGCTVAELAERTELSTYAVGVLCDMAISSEVLEESSDRMSITKLGSILLHDRLTQVNFNFVHDVCYLGMFELDRSIREGRPAGLSVFSDADTIYQCVTELPADAQQSWYEFDHFYSDRAFREAAAIVFDRPVQRLLDIGGNTGRWATIALERSPDVRVTIADLPGQLEKAKSLLRSTPHFARSRFLEVDFLADDPALPGEYDVIWMSQFLDCFAEAEIARILTRARGCLADNGRLYIMETLTDRQRFDAATYSLNATSLYFTAIANGNSRMYRGTTLGHLIRASGLDIVAMHDDLGLGHTLVECVARPA